MNSPWKAPLIRNLQHPLLMHITIITQKKFSFWITSCTSCWNTRIYHVPKTKKKLRCWKLPCSKINSIWHLTIKSDHRVKYLNPPHHSWFTVKISKEWKVWFNQHETCIACKHQVLNFKFYNKVFIQIMFDVMLYKPGPFLQFCDLAKLVIIYKKI